MILSDLFERMASALFKASAKASEAQIQHILFTIDAEGKVLASGSQNMMAAMVLDPNMFEATKQLMRNVYSNEPVSHANTHQLDYPPLPCAPDSPEWKDGAKVRAVLTQLLVTAGYGRHARKYGQGQPPFGWPEDVDWNNFKGATRSGLGIADLTRIIIGMLTAAGLDPNQHIVAPVAEDNQPAAGNELHQGGQQGDDQQHEGDENDIDATVDMENNDEELVGELNVDLAGQNRGINEGITVNAADIEVGQVTFEELLDVNYNLNRRNVGN